MQVKLLRVFRKIHRTTGAFLFVFFFVISISGLLLGWKKNSGGIILPKSAKGSSTVLNEWISLDSLKKNDEDFDPRKHKLKHGIRNYD